MTEKIAMVKAFLRNIRKEREYMQELAVHLEEVRAMAEDADGAIGSIGKNENCAFDNKTTDGITRLMATRKKLIKQTDCYASLSAYALEIIKRIHEPSERRVLLLYYFPKPKDEFADKAFEDIHRTWEEVAEKMHCDVRTAQRYHGKALASFAEFFDTSKAP